MRKRSAGPGGGRLGRAVGAMLSYRHAFHAGGPADVLKHAVLVFVLRYLVQKAKPLYVLDTHAGAGAYDLGAPMALKTGEFRCGIGRLLARAGEPPALVDAYLQQIRAAAVARSVAWIYPGSPLLIRPFLRRADRLELAELHPTDHRLLAERLRGVPGVRIERADGLALLVARMPPAERRSLVLIDPSYEVKTDYDTVVSALVQAHRRFPSGVLILWYPVIERRRADALLAALAATGMPAQYRLELCQKPDGDGHGLTGSGVIVVNPPWTLPLAAPGGLAWLEAALAAAGPSAAGWLVPERSAVSSSAS